MINGRALLATCMVLCGASLVSAQSFDLAGRYEVAVGGQWLGASSLGTQNAALTMGSGTALNLFQTTSTFGGTLGLEARVARRLTPRVDLEAFGGVARPAIETSVTNDFENAAPVTASDTVKQFAIGGGLLWYPPVHVRATRVHPFVLGGAAYLRQLHESDTLAANGAEFDGGGGVKIILRSRASRLRTVGVRADARLAVSTRGVAFASGAIVRPVLTAELFFRSQP